MKDYAFENTWGSLRIRVYAKPSEKSEQHDVVLTRRGHYNVMKIFWQDDNPWAMLASGPAQLGWINRSTIGRLELDAYD